MGKVTAIVSAYYAEQFLNRRLANLFAQTPIPEVVVVAQAGSPEMEIALSYDVVLYSTVNIPTIYAAWNLAIKASSGEYITNANSDDLLFPGSLRVMSETLDKNPEIALCYGDCDVSQVYGGDPVNRYEWAEGGFEELLAACFVGPMPMWRRSLHQKYGYFDQDMYSAGDYEYWLRISKSGESFMHLPRAIGTYLARLESAGHREPLRVVWETARARSRYSNML